MTSTPSISVIICLFNMFREGPRTIHSVLPPYQKNVEIEDYEVIVVDNGATPSLSSDYLSTLPGNFQYHQYPGNKTSPVHALNWAAFNLARGQNIMFCIDGARILSQSMISQSLLTLQKAPTAFVYSLGFHLGPDTHMNADLNNYDTLAEDKLLSDIRWRENPNRLFEISQFAGSSQNGFFRAINESNAFTLSRELLLEHGGYNEGFCLPGGGLSNLEIFSRYVTRKNGINVCLLSEGSFHQIHGGIATSKKINFETMHDEYLAIMGKTYRHPKYDMLLSGPLYPEIADLYTQSLAFLK